MLGPVHPRYIPVPFQDSAESGRLILRDGSTAQVRVATGGDSAALADFFRRLSPESRRHRFLSAAPPAPDLVSTLCPRSDGHFALTLVATRRHEGAPQIIATGSYLATGEKVAEVAMAVDDAFHVCFRVAPLSDADAAELVRGIRGFRLLEGYRGHPAADLSAIEETLLRVSRLAEEVPEIGELDLNPVFAFPPGEGCRIADARVQVRVPANMLQGVAGKSPIAEA